MRADSLTFACVKCKDYSLQRETKKGGGGDGGVEVGGGVVPFSRDSAE